MTEHITVPPTTAGRKLRSRSPIREQPESSPSTVRRFELECSSLRLRAIVSTMPTQCPMCACKDWEFADWRPFTR
jgi:hypothetical protein